VTSVDRASVLASTVVATSVVLAMVDSEDTHMYSDIMSVKC